MNTTELLGNGYPTMVELKQIFLLLTDSDLLLLENKQDEILYKLQTKYGKSKQEKLRYIPEA